MSFSIRKTFDHALSTLVHLPGTLVHSAEGEFQRLVPDHFVATAHLPAYTPLPANALAVATARSNGLKTPQVLQRSKGGGACEPTTIVASGTKEQLTRALEQAGWTRAEKLSIWSGIKSDASLLDKLTGLSHLFNYNYKASPMTVMYQDGKAQTMAFNKNDDHHTGRDHLRVFDSGKKDAKGNPIWNITATRDEAIDMKLPSFSKGHHVDSNIDPERDMVMADLLKSGVKDWQVAQGQMSAADKAAIAGHYSTDGKIYMVDFNS